MKKRWYLEEKIFQPFGKKEKKFLHLVRSGQIGIDNLVDEKGYSHKYILRIIRLAKRSWNKKISKTQNKYEKQFISAIRILRHLFDSGFYQAKWIYEYLLKEYDSEHFWAANRNKVLDSKTLKELNTNIGSGVSSIFLYFQMPKINSSSFKNIKNISNPIVQKYGFIIKEADNLASLYDDIFEGFITIPREDINKVSGLIIKNDKVISINRKGLKIDRKYVLKSIKEIKSVYKDANKLLDKNRQKVGLTKQQARLLKKWSYTWLEDAIK